MAKTSAILISFLGFQLCMNATAQTQSAVSSSKSAQELVAQYAVLGDNVGDRGVVRGLFWKGCPRADARRDSIFSGLMALDATPVQVMDMAISFAGNIKHCQDPRLESWFRKQVRRARDIGTVNALVLGLLHGNPTPENIIAAKSVALDPAAKDEIRTMVLSSLINETGKTLDARERVLLLAETYEKSGRIPEPYHTSEVAFIKSTFQVAFWRDRLTTALLAYPGAPGGIELLQLLGSDAIFNEGGANALWTARFRNAMVQLEADSRAPVTLKQGARKTRELLDERGRLDAVR